MSRSRGDARRTLTFLPVADGGEEPQFGEGARSRLINILSAIVSPP
jgi:hypothetical protein